MADTQHTTETRINPHLEGNLAPIRSEDDFEPKIRGKLPEGLTGA